MQPLRALLTLLLSLASCAGYGYLCLRLLGHRLRPDLLQLLCAIALGMGVVAYLVLAAGLLGGLHPGVLLVIGGAGWWPALSSLRQVRKLSRPAPGDAEPAGMERWATLLLAGYLGLLALLTLAAALGPLDGLDWDSLSYHLAAPKIYLHDGRISFIAYDSHTHFPFTMEMLYTLGLRFGGAPGAKLFHWAAGWLAALAVGTWTARQEIAGRNAPAWAGPLAAACFASMPIVLWEMGTAYVDLGTALFQFLALAVLVDAVRLREGRPEVAPEGAALAGVLSGFALGTKMTALLQFGLIGLALLWTVARAGTGERRPAFGAALRFGLLGLLVGSPWYVKSWLWTRNPVYPFFFSLFPHSYSWTRQAAEAYGAEQGSFGRGKGASEFLRVFWNLAVHGRAFYINFRSLTGDQIGSLGPVWAGMVPLVLWARGLGWKVWALLFYTLASLGIWFFLSQQSRYLIPLFAPLSAAAAATLAGLPTRTLRAAGGVFMGLAFFMSFGLHAPVGLSALALLSGQASEPDYLRATLPGLYEAAGFVNGLPENSRVALYQETRGFYFDRRYFWANPLQHNLIPYERLQTGDDLARELRRFGITHVLINYDFCRGVEGEKWYRLLADCIQRGRLVEVFRSERAEIGRRGVMVYALQ